MSVELRSPRMEDAAELARVFGVFAREYGEGDYESASDLETWFTNPGMNLEADARVAVADGEIVGYGDVSDAARDGTTIYLDLRVLPSQAGQIEPALFDFMEGRAGELTRREGTLRIWSPERAEHLRGLIAERGFTFEKYSFRMGIELDDEIPEPEWPEGIVLRPFDRDADTDLVYEVNQEAFEDEPGHVRDPYDEWRHSAFREPFDPGLWVLAFDGRELAGISLCRPQRGEDPYHGWIQELGVRRPWRRRGLALALLRHSLRELGARGKRRAGLGVSGENHAAVRLYGRAGMSVERTSLWYRKEV